ncbi:claudin-4-like [Rhinatrema bivittatum]|uniref:claudin-4-like n=1 Tax=Rhinatrema bivittatum TaxID=194408 RepID=UPI001128A3DE|nr:claudin-4-like [Rhinatrema bivittatum]XP_029462907.1 claudin-4-like [Rhinatrema bivittatum]XP_029462908.1 claudin-4-like [Rhinatrema bivittatum]
MMGASGVQLVGVILAICGLIGAIVCCALPKWKETSFTGQNIVTAQTTWEGIWMNCVVQSTGQMQCKTYDSMLQLPSDLQAARALTVVSIVLAVFGVLVAFVGAEFTTCVENEGAKSKVSLTAGIVIAIAGVMLIIPVSWSANTVIRNFYNPTTVSKMELGACIFIGWASSVLLLIAGGLLCFFRPREAGGNYSAQYYAKNAPSAPTSKNYV